MVEYPLETVKELKKMFPNNLEFHANLDNNSSDAWDFVSDKMGVVSDEMKNITARFKKLGDLFQSLSESGFPGA